MPPTPTHLRPRGAPKNVHVDAFVAPTPKEPSKIIKTVFLALLIDIMSFTIILPLFPRLLAHYQESEGGISTSMFGTVLEMIKTFRVAIGGSGSKFDVVLFGGVLGSMYSMLQFFVSPMIGKLSDRHGRRPVLLLCMLGNLVSAFVWIFASSFPLFVLSRVIAGLSEGNVQMSIAMITDVSGNENRSKSLAVVGIAFALGFTFGPPMGAYLMTVPDVIFTSNPYANPALLSTLIIFLEIVFLYLYLPETKHFSVERGAKAGKATASSSSAYSSSISSLSFLYFCFLLCFSGLEFTLPFLTFDIFNFSHSQKGFLLFFIGILSAFLQGFFRRLKGRHEKHLVVLGIACCSLASLALASIALGPDVEKIKLGFLALSAALLALTSATVVNNLTVIASFMIKGKTTGETLGKFRSFGQLGRALGPLVGCSVYWVLGVSKFYSLYAGLLGIVVIFAVLSIAEKPDFDSKTKSD